MALSLNGSTGISGINGSAGTPALQGSDADTGIFFGTDTASIATAGSERLIVDASGNINIDSGGVYYDAANNRLAIGTTSPGAPLEIGSSTDTATLRFRSTFTSFGSVADISCVGTANETSNLVFSTRNLGGAVTERARITSDGKLLVGTSTWSVGATAAFVANSNSATGNADVHLSRGLAATGMSSNQDIAVISFSDNAGAKFAQIGAQVDATPGSGDYPGRLVFSTTRDGAASPTAAMRIGNQGNVTIGSVNNSIINALVVTHGGSGGPGVSVFQATNGSYTGTLIEANLYRSATSSASVFKGFSSNFGDAEFNLRGDGNAYADGSWNGGGADYAEYFEWSDGNTDAKDRRGISVVLDGDKIRPALNGEDPIGVISGNPSVVGDAAWNKWSGKYLRDDYGTYIQEDYEVEDEDGNIVIQQRRKLNPAYDPDQEYISREQRPEWDCVGLMGKLRLRKGQPTGSRWIKMRDISDSVEEWLVR